MKRLICRWFGHDWLYLHETRMCQCNPRCFGTYERYTGQMCRRCDEGHDWPQLREPAA